MDNEIEVSPSRLQAFEEVFLGWYRTYPNWEHLEAGSTGNLEDLARRCLRWAQDR